MKFHKLALLPAARGLSLLTVAMASTLNARLLGVHEFGVMSAGLAVAALATAMGPLGIDQIQIFRRLESEVANTAVGLVFAAVVLIGTVLATSWPGLAPAARLCALLGTVALSARILLTPWLTEALRDLKLWRRARRELSTTALAGGLSVLGALGHSAVTSMTGLVVGWSVAAAVVWRPAMTRKACASAMAALRSGLQYSWSALAYTLYFSVDLALLAAFVPAGDVGEYRASYVLVSAALVLPVALNNDLLRAEVARTPTVGDARGLVIRKFGAVSVVAGILATASLYLVGPAIVTTLFGPSFTSSGSLVAVLAFMLLPNFVNSWLANTLVSVGHVASVVRVQFVLLFGNVAANLIVIPRLGTSGAAYVSVATEILGLTIYSVVSLQSRATKKERKS